MAVAVHRPLCFLEVGETLSRQGQQRRAFDLLKDLADLPLAEMREVHSSIHEGIFDVLGVHESVASRTSYGGTAPDNVRREAQAWLDRLSQNRDSRRRTRR